MQTTYSTPQESLPTINESAWEHDAACAGHPSPEIFFPSTWQERRQQQAWKACCDSCPVRQLCADYATERSLEGVWGGELRDSEGKVMDLTFVAPKGRPRGRKAIARKGGRPIHALTEVDPEERTGVCAICGPVDVIWRNDRAHYRCGPSRRATDRRTHARKKAQADG